MDYELPPEINSGRMYAGLGSASLMESAAAWQALAAQLGSAGAAFGAVIEALTSTAWAGPSSMSMALSAAPYVVWMIETAAQCQEAAAAAAAAAAAFEAARAGVVPPPVIAENRAQLAALVSTNFMGFNTPAIMANEAHYGQMWSQDTATMYDFAGNASGITGALVPFVPPRPTRTRSGWPRKRPRWASRAAPPPGSSRSISPAARGACRRVWTASPCCRWARSW